MKYVFIRSISPFMLIIMCFCSLSFSAFAAKQKDVYKSYLVLTSGHQGATRKYKKKNIKFSATTQSYIGNKEIK